MLPQNDQKVTITSEDIQNEHLQKLRKVFPQFVKDGVVDFDALKVFFDKERILPENDEKYGLGWAGKSNAFKHIRTQATGTLAPDKESSKNWDETENLFIEGDNLEVLKLVQKQYREKIKMIYIDPPYNTGKDFVYKDNFRENVSDYYERTGQSEGGIKMTSNFESNGRYHSDWLTMMYPRLFLARNLLKEDGVIFISINDYEMHNLRLIMDEIFGEENSLTESPTALIWQQSGTSAGHFAAAHEYILCYAKCKRELPFFQLNDYGDNKHITDRAVKKISKSNPASSITFPAGIEFEGDSAEFDGEIGGSEKEIIKGKMIFKNGKLYEPVVITAGWGMREQILSWLDGEETFDSKGQKIVRFFFNSRGILWYEKERGTIHPSTILPKIVGNTKQGTKEVTELFSANVMSYPKPISLLQYLFSFTTKDKDIVLDFFAGSGTIAHAVMAQNAEDGGNRKWICVQLPEVVDENSEAKKAGFSTISEIARERIIRAGKQIGKGDVGFKSYKLAASNYRQWRTITDEDDEETLRAQMKLFVEKPLADDYTEEGIVYEILLKEGFDLNSKVSQEKMGDLDIWRVVDGERRIVVSFAKKLSVEEVGSLGLNEHDIFICLDSALDDTTKVNIMRNLEVRVI